MKGLHASQEIFYKIVDLSFLGIFVNNLLKSCLSTKYANVYFFLSNDYTFFSVILSNENKQRLYKIQKRPTSLFYHVLLIKQNECTYVHVQWFINVDLEITRLILGLSRSYCKL
jgi:hypothetical protein